MTQQSSKDGRFSPQGAKPSLPKLAKSLPASMSIPVPFSGHRYELGIAQTADMAGLKRAKRHRYASAFVQLGYLEQVGFRKYRLSSCVVEPGLSVVGSIRKALSVLRILKELRDVTGYTVSLGALDRTQVTYIHRVYSHRLRQYHVDKNMGAGTHIPIHCTALGKALLVGLGDMERRRIIAQLDFVPYGPNSIMERIDLITELASVDHRKPIVSDEEFQAGTRSIAMYVPRSTGKLNIAIEVTVPSAALPASQLQNQLGPHLERAVKLTSEILQHK